MSLTRADILPNLIVLPPTHECSIDTIPIIFEINLKSKKPSTLFGVR